MIDYGCKTKVGSWDNPYWQEKYTWDRTWTDHIWRCIETDLYHYSDETSQFDIWGYESKHDCEEALDHYVDYLNGK